MFGGVRLKLFLFSSPVEKFLLDGGQCQSWLLGNKIITITTSGGSKVGKAGLCQKCLSMARVASGIPPKIDDPPPVTNPGTRGLSLLSHTHHCLGIVILYLV